MAPACTCSPPALMDELVEEILLHRTSLHTSSVPPPLQALAPHHLRPRLPPPLPRASPDATPARIHPPHLH
ncbi:hypothetical protein ACP70R_015193 [Stipagrostis hirtigluma subsp. patula]